jgi:hypothetical protein
MTTCGGIDFAVDIAFSKAPKNRKKVFERARGAVVKVDGAFLRP